MEAASQRYGDIFNVPALGNYATILFLSHPEALKQLFTSDPTTISAPSNRLMHPIVGDRSIFWKVDAICENANC